MNNQKSRSVKQSGFIVIVVSLIYYFLIVLKDFTLPSSI